MGEMLSKKTPVTETSTTQTILPEWLTNASKGAVDFAQSIPNFVPFTGEGVAGLNGLLSQAFSGASALPGQFGDAIKSAIGGITSGLNFNAPSVTAAGIGSDATSLMNPFIKNVIDSTNTEIDRQKAIELERAGAAAARGGAFSAGAPDDRAGLLANDTARNMEEIRAKTIGGLLSGGFDNAQRTALALGQGNQNAAVSSAGVRNNTAGTVGNLANTGSNMGWGDISGLLSTGGAQRDIDQQGKTFNYQEFLRGVQSPFQKLQALMASMQGPHNTTQNTTGTKEMYSSPLGQMIGAGLGLAGMMGTGGMSSLLNGAGSGLFGLLSNGFMGPGSFNGAK
jgi:hypothetical protein